MITSRQALIDYALRKLGAPVLQINLAREQIEDRLNEALRYFQEYHSEAIRKTYFKHAITASHVLVTDQVGSFEPNAELTSNVTNITFRVFDSEDNKIRTLTFGDTNPIVGETVSDGNGNTATVAAVFIGDTQNRYLSVPDDILSVSRIFPFSQTTSSQYMFDARYQLMMSEIQNLNVSGLNYYYSVQQHVSQIEFLLSASPQISFNRMTGRIELYTDWERYMEPGRYLMFEAYAGIDADANGKVYNDIFVQRYFVALMKQQWAQNLSKFSELALPGGVKLNASAMMAEAREDIAKLEEQILDKFSAPLGFFMG